MPTHLPLIARTTDGSITRMPVSPGQSPRDTLRHYGQIVANAQAPAVPGEIRNATFEGVDPETNNTRLVSARHVCVLELDMAVVNQMRAEQNQDPKTKS